MATEIESCKAFVWHCAQLHAEGEYAVKECSMAKLLASELSDKVMYQCLQFFGGYGYMEEYKIGRMWRDSRIGTIGGGSSEIMREIIAKMVIDDVNYQGSALPGSGAALPSSGTNGTASNGAASNGSTNGAAADVPLAEQLQARFSGKKPLGKTLKFALDSGPVYIDGTGEGNAVAERDDEADCTVNMSREDFDKLIAGQLNAMEAVMGGRIRIDGDMGVAMKLQGLFA
jgi:putative sterol carrier protein